jgi:hypothetical protein
LEIIFVGEKSITNRYWKFYSSSPKPELLILLIYIL